MSCPFYKNCDAYCWADETCWRCHGKGLIIDFAIGLGASGLVPSYVEQLCPSCSGDGLIRIFCRYYR